MDPWLDRLLFLVVGAGLTLLTQYLTNRQSLQHSLALARHQRRYGAGHEAYKEANAVISLAMNFALRAVGGVAISSDEARVIMTKVATELFASRKTLGLETSAEARSALVDAIFETAAAFDRPTDVQKSATHLLLLFAKQQEEVTDAWRRTIDGNTTIAESPRK